MKFQLPGKVTFFQSHTAYHRGVNTFFYEDEKPIYNFIEFVLLGMCGNTRSSTIWQMKINTKSECHHNWRYLFITT